MSLKSTNKDTRKKDEEKKKTPLHHKKVAKRLLVLTSIHSSKDSQFRVVELSLVDVFLLDTKAKGFVAPGSDE